MHINIIFAKLICLNQINSTGNWSRVYWRNCK